MAKKKIQFLTIETLPHRKKPSLMFYQGNEYMVSGESLATFQSNTHAQAFYDMVQDGIGLSGIKLKETNNDTK